jgi:hypothetical protein
MRGRRQTDRRPARTARFLGCGRRGLQSPPPAGDAIVVFGDRQQGCLPGWMRPRGVRGPDPVFGAAGDVEPAGRRSGAKPGSSTIFTPAWTILTADPT